MNKKLFILILISTLVRLFFATFLELGNDEVYYRTFGLYPDWSYFDHSPMVGWLVRLTTLGMADVSEAFVRLGSVIIGAINTYIIYSIAKKLTNNLKTSYIAALLYTGSVYCSVIFGTFIMPDTPMSLFWLLTIMMFVEILPNQNYDNKKMLLAGVFIGLAMLSKYTGAYLWGAAGLYILLFNRKWLTKWSLYVSVLISIVIFLPVIIWNYQFDFISFTFHSGRVTADNSINWLYFGREIFGSFFYNNPINFVIAVMAIFGYKSIKEDLSKANFRFLLIFSLPMILLFLIISLTRETLPHWAAPAYFTLIILSSIYLTNKKRGLTIAKASPIFLLIVLIVGFAQIKLGFVELGSSDEAEKGRGDFTLDMYGWRQAGEKFHQYRLQDTLMPKDAPLVQFSWDAASHIDTYFAQPYGYTTKIMTDLGSSHYWEWISRERGGFATGDSVYLVVTSRFPIDPFETYGDQFEKIVPADTLKVERNGKHVTSFYIYKMLGLKPTSPSLLPLRDVLKLK